MTFFRWDARGASPFAQTPGRLMAVLLSVGIVGCAEMKTTPPPLEVDPTVRESAIDVAVPAPTEAPRIESRTEPIISPIETIARTDSRSGAGAAIGTGLPTTPIDIAYDQLPMAAFINESFGEALGVAFEVHPDIANRSERVTLRTGGPRTGAEFLALVRQVLLNYGIQVVQEESLFRIVPNEEFLNAVPQIIRSRSASQVPTALRPIFQYVPLRASKADRIEEHLRSFIGDKLNYQVVRGENALILVGLSEDVRAALDIIEVLDQPKMADTISVKIEPAYWAVGTFTGQLEILLATEGFTVVRTIDSRGAISLLPIARLNTLYVFAQDQDALERVLYWVRELDVPKALGDSTGVYVYPVLNTNADRLIAIINGENTSGGINEEIGDSGDSDGGADTVRATTLPGGERVVVDSARNTLIITATPEQYARILPLLKQLDKPAREVLIEVTIAEVTLDDQTEFGINWLIENANLGDFSVTGGTEAGLAVGGSGFNLSLSRPGDLRAALNAFADNERVNVLSTPRIVTISGQEAFISVGSQVPIITSQSNSPLDTDGSTNILQTIQYRDSGVILTVTPIVRAGDRVELQVNQEVSSVTATTNSAIPSPTFTDRRISTSLSLADGATAVLGGLIQETITTGESGIPFLKDIPVIGNVFKTQSNQLGKTELLVLITPYIIESPEESQAIADALRDRFGRVFNESFDTLGLKETGGP